MANYYYVKIKKNVNQELAAEIFARLATFCKIRQFSFRGDSVTYNTRGLIDIEDLLEKYGINEEDIDVADEFELNNNNL